MAILLRFGGQTRSKLERSVQGWRRYCMAVDGHAMGGRRPSGDL